MNNNDFFTIQWKNMIHMLAVTWILLFGMIFAQLTAAEEIMVPTSFTWSGGSGRLKGIECPELYVRDSEIWAKIIIKSENYIYIKVDDIQYDRMEKKDKESIFEIPIRLNEDMQVFACTTAMSTEHEVEYTFFIGYNPDLENAQKENLKAGLEESKEELNEASKEKTNEASKEESIKVSTEGEGSKEDLSEDLMEELSLLSEYVEEEIPEISDLVFINKMNLQFAKGFDIYYYEEGYKVLSIHSDRKYLLVPDGKEIPENLGKEYIVLKQPLDQIYLAATAAMSLFDAIDGMDAIRLSSVQEAGWYIENAVTAMKEGRIIFAGKYNEPDYELMIGEGCDLAVESTMILHSPKVQEMIEEMGIPVFVDRSSYEEHPLGRTEWIKVYGALLNKETEAEEFFKEQASIMDELKDFQNTEKTVAFFYISTDGSVVVRTPQDYVPRMIEIAGGRYLFDYLDGGEGKKSSVNLTMEEFYATAIDADYLVYNATIEDPIYTMEDLYRKDELFADFKAVQNGNVWCAGKYLYQATDIVGNMINDLHLMLIDGSEEEMTFITRIR